MFKPTRSFLMPDEFNKLADRTKTNCFAFAFGQTSPSSCSMFSEYVLEYKDSDNCILPIDYSFTRRAAAFDYTISKVDGNKLPDSPDGRTYFLLFGWYACGDFHVVRITPDGKWVHKPDWSEPATVVDPSELLKEYELIRGDYHVFVLV